jgi:hypothetical protein
MKLTFTYFTQKTAIIIGSDERGLIFISIMISKQCRAIWYISIVLPLTISRSENLVSWCLLKQRKKGLFFLTATPETKLRHRNPLHKANHLYLMVWEMLKIFLTHSDSLSSLTAVHISIWVLKLLHDLQRSKVVVPQSDLAAEPCWSCCTGELRLEGHWYLCL